MVLGPTPRGLISRLAFDAASMIWRSNEGRAQSGKATVRWSSGTRIPIGQRANWVNICKERSWLFFWFAGNATRESWLEGCVERYFLILSHWAFAIASEIEKMDDRQSFDSLKDFQSKDYDALFHPPCLGKNGAWWSAVQSQWCCGHAHHLLKLGLLDNI